MNLNNIPLWHMERTWETPAIQEWWLKRWRDPEVGACSNIRIGDFFTLGKNNQVGIISEKVIMCYPENHEWKPDGSGPFFQYTISGDIGGHWHRPSHEEMEHWNGGETYFLFIPSATQLAEIDRALGSSVYYRWARKLLDYYLNHPFAITHQGHLNIEARKKRDKEKADGLEDA